jgi:hypothetical protein
LTHLRRPVIFITGVNAVRRAKVDRTSAIQAFEEIVFNGFLIR